MQVTWEDEDADLFFNDKTIESAEVADGAVDLRTGVESSGVFASCSNLEVVKLPESLRIIGCCSFSYCASLMEVSVPSGVIELGERAFFACESLEKVTLPQGIHHLPKELFCCCKSLRSINLPTGLKMIGDIAFSSCRSLSSVNFDELQDLEYIGGGAFRGCSSLAEVNLSELIKLTEIGQQAFFECSSLVDFAFPPKVTVVKRYTFRGCSSLANVRLPTSLQTIGMAPFSNCPSDLCFEASDSIDEGALDKLKIRESGRLRTIDAAGQTKKTYIMASKTTFWGDKLPETQDNEEVVLLKGKIVELQSAVKKFEMINKKQSALVKMLEKEIVTLREANEASIRIDRCGEQRNNGQPAPPQSEKIEPMQRMDTTL